MLKEKELVKKDYTFIKDSLGLFSFIFGVSAFLVALGFAIETNMHWNAIYSTIIGSICMTIGIIYCHKRYNW
ncbi:MAG: hypothetical protein M0R17_03305 [Candidatus Omnitrophica bacterium]|jgi:hypothetical protein|nr:hypothetical protein [Candidatus Omnitrophota bacterium]